MTKSQRKRKPNCTLFRCRAPDARQVFVAGTFNNWDSNANPMEPSGDGTWSLRLDLPPGRHEYRYVIDGEWSCAPGDDDAACNNVPNAFGTMNLIIDVSEARA